ncbi:MAG: RNA polymerase sigma factor [Acutalibacteraceae bacterium]
MRSEIEVSQAIDKYADTVKRICMIQLKNFADAEDVFQTVFLKYALSAPVFESEQHEKAWIIRVTMNACKDLLKHFFRSRTVPLDEVIEQAAPQSEDNRYVLEAVMSLPQKYREVIYLHFYEEYTAPQIGEILEKNTNTIYTLITRAKSILKKKLGGEFYGK